MCDCKIFFRLYISKKIYSYLKALKVLILEIFIAGKYDAIAEINNEIIKIIIIESNLISLGNLSKKYISDGKISKLKLMIKKFLIFQYLKKIKFLKLFHKM